MRTLYNLEHALHSSSWPTSDRVRPSKQTLLLNSRPTSYTVLHFHLWIQTLVMMVPTCPCGSKRSQTSKGEKDCTAPLLVASVLGKPQMAKRYPSGSLTDAGHIDTLIPLDPRKDGLLPLLSRLGRIGRKMPLRLSKGRKTLWTRKTRPRLKRPEIYKPRTPSQGLDLQRDNDRKMTHSWTS